MSARRVVAVIGAGRLLNDTLGIVREALRRDITENSQIDMVEVAANVRVLLTIIDENMGVYANAEAKLPSQVPERTQEENGMVRGEYRPSLSGPGRPKFVPDQFSFAGRGGEPDRETGFDYQEDHWDSPC